MRASRAGETGFTLIELMVVVAVVAIVLTLAVPSFHEFIVAQRLKSTNAALVTDLQFARSEAVSRGAQVRVRFQSAASGGPGDLSCYIIFAEFTPPAGQPPLCDCKAAEGARCTAAPTSTELRTVRIPTDLSVGVQPRLPAETFFAFDPRTGGIIPPPADGGRPPGYDFAVETLIDNTRRFRNLVGMSGRVKVCIPAGSTMPGDAC